MSSSATLRFPETRVLVTGAAQGIGLAVAERFAQEGASVIIADIDRDAAESVAEVLTRAGHTAEFRALDVTDSAAVADLASTLRDIDTVVANAGVQSFVPLRDLGASEWDRVMAVNGRGTLLTLQLAASVLRDGGSAIAMASIPGRLANPLSAHYAASKAAVLSLTKSFARDLAPRRIRVNAVKHGRIDTPLSEYANAELGRLSGSDADELARARAGTIPLGRPGHASEVAAVVAFLASDDASYITGECIDVCGGDVMR